MNCFLSNIYELEQSGNLVARQHQSGITWYQLFMNEYNVSIFCKVNQTLSKAKLMKQKWAFLCSRELL